MRLCHTHYTGRNGEKRQSKTWSVEFRDHLDTVRRTPAFRDKRASEEFGRKLERLVSLRVAGEQPDSTLVRWLGTLPAKIWGRLAKIGLLDSRWVAASQPLSEHLDEYKQALLDKGNTPLHAHKTTQRITAILDEMGATFPSDVIASRVAR